MININKLFPRLSIRVKLAIAFAGVALGPLAVISLLGARETVRQIQSKAHATLQHDLEMVEAQTSQALGSAERDVELLAQLVLEPLLTNDGESTRALAQNELVVRSLLAADRSLYQVKLIDATGRYRLFLRAPGVVRSASNAASGEFYAWRARVMKPNTRLLFAVEVAGPDEKNPVNTIPAVAIVLPLHSPTGTFTGVVVGEAYASEIFSQLDRATPGFAGVTALVDEGGRFLFHSVRKQDWSTLLANQDRVTVRSEFSPDVAAAIVSGHAGSVVTAQQNLLSFRPLSLGAHFGEKLALYRVVPLSVLTADARAFLVSVLIEAVLVTFLVLGVALASANQFTKPIFQIREAAWQLARSDPVMPLNVATNDEFEDLAHDFTAVAAQVAAHRAQREEFIAERARMLEQTHAELTDILEHSADGIIGLDPDRVIRIWNNGAERLFGYPSALAIGQDIDRVLRPATEQAWRERGVLKGELAREKAVVNFLTEILDRAGAVIQISLTETLIASSDGRPLGSSLIVRDNRFQSRLEDQMRRSERLAAISVMAAGLAHEINNPLAIIGNRIECMQRDILDNPRAPSLAADIDVLQQHVTRLRELTSSLLRFARDDKRSEARPVLLGALAERTVALLRRTLATRQIRLDLAVDPLVPAVIGYEQAIETVIVNLLLNAADATPPGGTVTLMVRRGTGSDVAEIEVRDTGPGIAPSLHERVFEPFFTTKDTGHGTGLGLTVCRSIVDGHGGSIRVDGRPGSGCRLIVSLPVQPIGATWPEPAFS